MKPEFTGKTMMKLWQAARGIAEIMLHYKSGISKLPVSVIFIASITIPTVYGYMVSDDGLFFTRENRVAACTSSQWSPATLKYSSDTAVPAGYELNDADEAWTALPYVTAKADVNSYVEGTASACLRIDDKFGTGIIAYHNVTGTSSKPDLSDYDSVTFWIKSSEKLSDGVLQLMLSGSDFSTGVTESLEIPGSVLDGSWHKVIISLSGTDVDYGDIKNVALYTSRDPGEVTIWLDIIETEPALSASRPAERSMSELVYAPTKGASIYA